eukprot:Nk52_evm12s2650 gene=Nk52_evmTU12s2650
MKQSYALIVLVGILLVAGCFPVQAWPWPSPKSNRLFNNLFVFGDSLSDIGNLSPSPFTNDVDKNGFFSVDPVTKHPFTEPTRKYSHCVNHIHKLPTGTKNNGYGWSEYFMQIAQAKGVTPSTGIVPSMSLYHDKCKKQVEKDVEHVSINYAWASATTYGPCKNASKYPFDGPCNPYTVYNAWKSNDVDAKLPNVKVPPVSVQHEFFMQDIATGKVKAQKDDLVVIWTGANDLMADFLNVTKAKFHYKVEAIESIAYTIADQMIKDAARFLDDTQHPINQVYVVNMFNPNIAPVESAFPGANILGLPVAVWFNNQVKFHINAYNLLHLGRKRIHLVDAFGIFNDMAKDKSLFGLSFNSKKKAVKCPVPKTNSEDRENCRGYLTQYDGTHPTAPAHQQFSAKVFDFVKAHHNVW